MQTGSVIGSACNVDGTLLKACARECPDGDDAVEKPAAVYIARFSWIAYP
jgi:hypothetical protein